MSVAVEIDPSPLRTDDQGVIRVGGTRVTLEQIVGAFREGVTAEEIALRYETVGLADVYATIAYYLNHRESVERYLASQAEKADNVRREHAETLDMTQLRQRLLARRGST